MTHASAPFAIARPLSGHLDALLAYWQGLRRGGAEVPFWDDIVMTDVKRLCSEVFLLDVFAGPERFRLSAVEVGLAPAQQEEILGRFIDDVALPEPFALLRAQCSVTVEQMRPTVYAHAPVLDTAQGYQRLLLPAWGEGQIRMLLGAVERG